MSPRADTHPRRRVRLVLVPWLVYVGMTVVVPALNGASRDPAFAEHAIITLGVSGAVTMLWLAARHRPGRLPGHTSRSGATRRS